jgi:hypothetical protein
MKKGREAHTQKGRRHGRNAVDWEAKEKTEKRNSGFCLVVWLNELCPRKNVQSQVSPSERAGTQLKGDERIFIKYLYTVF